MEKITKSAKYEMLEEILNTVEHEHAAMLIEFVQSERAALSRKAEKAKEKAAEKKTELDELAVAVLEVMTGEPQSRDEIFEKVADFDAEVSVAKVGARLTKLVTAGKVVKSEVKAVTASGKKTTRMAYALAESVEVE